MEIPDTKDIIAQYGLSARKSLGQHFLLDQNITDKIVRVAGDLQGVHVCEIGPGPGGLTRSLLASDAASVLAIEPDGRMVEALSVLQQAYGSRLTLHQQDALACDITQMLPAPCTIIANLPYNVGTEMLLGWLEQLAKAPDSYQMLVLMFQKEVGERLAASPGSKAYGRLSIFTQWLCKVEPVMHLPARAFSPPPKVDSVVVRLTPYATPLYPANAVTLARLTHLAFQQRRKMLRGSLKSLGADFIEGLASLGISPEARPETLSVKAFCDMANYLDARSSAIS